ncbi:MAG: hypothetical protein ACFCU2_06980 [Acidimicrobiia bacterium]
MTAHQQETRIEGSQDLSRVYERFGKADFLASLVGMFAGFGALVFLGALFGAGAAGIDFQINMLNEEGVLDEASIIGLIVAAVVVFAAFIVGGFAAGRMSRYNGGMNGLGAGLWALLLITVFAALGAWVGAEYNAFSAADLPNWVAQIDADDLTTGAVIGAVVLSASMLFGGYTGGRLGELYHRRVDAAIVEETRKEV